MPNEPVEGVLNELRNLLIDHPAARSKVSREAGLAHNTVQRWLTGVRTPNLRDFEAVMGMLGYRIVIEKIE